MKIQYIDNKKILDFGYCEVVQERESYNAIYRKGELLTHELTWKRATKIATLLKVAYDIGKKNGYDEGYEDSYDYL